MEVIQAPRSPQPTHISWESAPVLLKYHRLLTGSGCNPPNSMNALEECLVGGAAAIEFDVNLTCDQQFVLLHDQAAGLITERPFGENGRQLTSE